MATTSCETEEYANCNSKDLTMKDGDFKFQWPEWCEVFHGNLNLRVIDLDNADFSKLRKINGSINLINSQTRTMPYMPKLKVIQSDGIRPGVVILNNKELRDMRGFVNWDKEVKVIGHPDFPIFISGNTELDTINLPKAFHKPLSPTLCEKRLAPGYNIQFAESLSLATTLITLILSATIFLYPMSLGSGIVYFVPGYHKEAVN
ncbi:unnamed protein product [Caenorhabditis brenneri]